MKWLTTKELSQIVRKSQDSDKNVPERTIRHMAVQKKIQSKKVGKTWVVDPISAIKAGLYIEPEVLEKLKSVSPLPTEETRTNEQHDTKNKNISDKKRKSQSLGDLGVYSELKKLYLEKNSKMPEQIKENVKQTLFHLALGYYDYPKANKAEYFRRARKFLVNAIVEDDLSPSEKSEWRDQLENSIMPGIIGLVRIQEGVKRGNKREQSQTQRKD